MFYKIGFYVLLVLLIICAGLFLMTNPMKRTGAMSWVDIYSNNPAATIEFLNDNFDIAVTKTQKTPTGQEYSIIKTKGQVWPFAGIMETPSMPNGVKAQPGTTMYLTVQDYNAAHSKVVKSGAVPYATNLKNDTMTFGFYKIPGDITLGIVQYTNNK